jgi:hypothetical protein
VAETVANGGHDGRSRALTERLLARCRSEGSAAYRLLRAAATLAQPFNPDNLAALLRSDQLELIDELERLCARRILHVDGTRFGFRYDLVREALLGSLSPARRALFRIGGSADAPTIPAWPRSG